jgi:outer membrane protein assembly factor BamB
MWRIARLQLIIGLALGCSILALVVTAESGWAGAGPTRARQADGTAPWTAFGFNVSHSSYNSRAVSVTTENSASLTQAWEFVTPPPTVTGQPNVGFDGSPVVADGMVFIGSNTGIFYALSEDTGKVVWSLNAGFLPEYTCSAAGIEDTAAVSDDPTTGKPTVYFASASGTLFAVDAATGSVVWQTDVFPPASASVPFIWDSPTIYGGRVYIGISSECDKPLVRGGLASFDQATGAHEATFWTVSSKSIGGSIWSTAAVSRAGVFVTTGNGDESKPSTQGLSNSIVLLNPATLKPISHWTVPNIATIDDDFGSSPTLFSATIDKKVTPMVGACNKNGVFYAWAQKALANGPIWSDQLGNSVAKHNDSCLATATWDGSHLFITTNSSTVAGVTYPGVARELDPATGTAVWQTGLSDGPVLGITALDGAGALAAITFSRVSPSTSNELTLIDAATGAVLATYPTPIQTGGGPVWADGYLLFGGDDGLLHSYTPTAARPRIGR